VAACSAAFYALPRAALCCLVSSLTRIVDVLLAAAPMLGAQTALESVEPALVDGTEGLALLWEQRTVDQGLRRFGLLATVEEIERLAATNSGDLLLSDLHLMLVEPHATEADEASRTWFRSVDGFIA
jgi:hypothetical protein